MADTAMPKLPAKPAVKSAVKRGRRTVTPRRRVVRVRKPAATVKVRRTRASRTGLIEPDFK